jgi:hypothetical protein
LATLETIKKYYRIDRSEICFLKFIVEAYDGLAVVTTVDSEAGIVILYIAPGCEADVETILQELKKTIIIEALDENQKYIHQYHWMSDECL